MPPAKTTSPPFVCSSPGDVPPGLQNSRADEGAVHAAKSLEVRTAVEHGYVDGNAKRRRARFPAAIIAWACFVVIIAALLAAAAGARMW